MSETGDLAAALLAAEPVERERLLRNADASDLAAALTALGHTRQTAAAEVLALVDLVVNDRALRKAARRELHRLRSIGIEPPAAVSPTPEPAQSHKDAPLQVSEAWATDVDATGSRAVWLVAEKPLGGVWFAAMLLNDQRGLNEMSLIDTTHKRFLKDLNESRSTAGTWVRLPGDYALGLVREAVDLARHVGGGLPTRYRAFRDVFGEAGLPERALVYATIAPVEVNLHPEWLDESARLTAEPEVAGWHVPLPAELRPRALEVARTPAAGMLVLPGHTPEQQAVQLLAEAARQGLTPPMRGALRRRLEETAYIFLETDRLNAARLAVAAARPLESSHLVAERHPFLRLLLASGLARLTGSEMVGTRRAAQVLIELIERATQSEGQTGAVETRPSGLILPR